MMNWKGFRTKGFCPEEKQETSISIGSVWTETEHRILAYRFVATPAYRIELGIKLRKPCCVISLSIPFSIGRIRDN
jgi:hypothetical protein